MDPDASQICVHTGYFIPDDFSHEWQWKFWDTYSNA